MKPLKLTLALLFCISITLTFQNSALAIPKAVKAKSEYMLAERMYNERNFQDCIKHAVIAKDTLGKSNSRIEYILTKAYFKNNQLDKAMASVELFFELTPESASGTKQYNEMVEFYSKIKFAKEKIAKQAKREKAKLKASYLKIKSKMEILKQITDLLPKKYNLQYREKNNYKGPNRIEEVDYDVSYNLNASGNTLKVNGSGTANAGVRFESFFGGYNEREYKKHFSINVEPFKMFVTFINTNYCTKFRSEQANEDTSDMNCDCKLEFRGIWLGEKKPKVSPWEDPEYPRTSNRTSSIDMRNVLHILQYSGREIGILIYYDHSKTNKKELDKLRDKFGIPTVKEYNEYYKYGKTYGWN